MKVQREELRVRGTCHVDTALLKQSFLFATLGESDLAALALGSSGHVYGQFEEIARPAEDEGALFLVVGGLVRLYAESHAGDEQTLVMLWPGDVCGHMFVQRGDRYETTLQAVADPTTVYRLLCTRVRELEA